MTNKHKIWCSKAVIHLISALLLFQLYYAAIFDKLGADPVEEVLHFTGMGALNLLLIGLSISPLAQTFKMGWLIQLRRLIGLYAFSYAFCHVLSFWAFEIQFDVNLFIEEVVERPYITVGMVAFSILLPLAVTSWNRIKRKMGKSWQKLHNWVYLAALLVAIHFYWSVKSDITEPVIYFIVLTCLLALRKEKLLKHST